MNLFLLCVKDVKGATEVEYPWMNLQKYLQSLEKDCNYPILRGLCHLICKKINVPNIHLIAIFPIIWPK